MASQLLALCAVIAVTSSNPVGVIQSVYYGGVPVYGAAKDTYALRAPFKGPAIPAYGKSFVGAAPFGGSFIAPVAASPFAKAFVAPALGKAVAAPAKGVVAPVVAAPYGKGVVAPVAVAPFGKGVVAPVAVAPFGKGVVAPVAVAPFGKGVVAPVAVAPFGKGVVAPFGKGVVAPVAAAPFGKGFVAPVQGKAVLAGAPYFAAPFAFPAFAVQKAPVVKKVEAPKEEPKVKEIAPIAKKMIAPLPVDKAAEDLKANKARVATIDNFVFRGGSPFDVSPFEGKEPAAPAYPLDNLMDAFPRPEGFDLPKGF